VQVTRRTSLPLAAWCGRGYACRPSSLPSDPDRLAPLRGSRTPCPSAAFFAHGLRLVPPCLCPKLSTTHDPLDSQQVRIIHPFHPLCGQSFLFVVSKKLWGEDRVTIQMADGSPRSVPVSWTDAIPADAYISVGGGRSRFRVDDLLALAELIAVDRRRR
jgi:hypothetical protein